jgi:hypothetical protein
MFLYLEPYIFFERRAENWIAPLTTDLAFLHMMIFTSQYYFDTIAILPRKPSRQHISPHFVKALRLLQERIGGNDHKAKLSFTTLAAVMGLTGHAYLTGDLKSARNHLEGLHKIVILRGGVSTFEANPKLLLEILRCDIGITLHTGSIPVFFSNTLCSEPFIPYPDLTLLFDATGTRHSCTSVEICHDLDNELAQAWEVMSYFCSLINLAAFSGQLISARTFLDTMASVFYRLFSLKFDSTSRDEAVRLALLGFSATVFLQWGHFGMSYLHLATLARHCFRGLKNEEVNNQLMIWLLMTASISIFDITDDAWVKPLLLNNMRKSGIEKWNDMQKLLKSFMWIDIVYESPGKAVFGLATRISLVTT